MDEGFIFMGNVPHEQIFSKLLDFTVIFGLRMSTCE